MTHSKDVTSDGRETENFCRILTKYVHDTDTSFEHSVEEDVTDDNIEMAYSFIFFRHEDNGDFLFKHMDG